MQSSPATRPTLVVSQSGKYEDGRATQLTVVRLCDYIAENKSGGQNAPKSIMCIQGFPVGPTRLPRLDLTEEKYTRLEADLWNQFLIDLPQRMQPQTEHSEVNLSYFMAVSSIKYR